VKRLPSGADSIHQDNEPKKRNDREINFNMRIWKEILAQFRALARP
jgi:hypothetical protein